MSIAKSTVSLMLALFALWSPVGVESDTAGFRNPRTLILSLDGVSYSAVQQARDLGAFAGWPDTKPMISTFPSVTNVGFTAIFTPFGAEPISGYELSHFNFELNKVTGTGPFGPKNYPPSWRRYYDVMTSSSLRKAAEYLHPKSSSIHTLEETEAFVLDSPKELMLAHIGATDALAHMRGYEEVVDLMVTAADRVDDLARRHFEKFGRPLRVVMFSDHGNSEAKVTDLGGIRDVLRAAGLRVVSSLEGPDDVVAPTYGVVGYGALYLDPSRAEKAARAVVGEDAIELAAWISGPEEVRVVARDGDAVIRWRDVPGGRRFAYKPVLGDPLRLSIVCASLGSAGHVDADGFISEDDWLEFSAFSDHPDAPRRLVDSLIGAYVRNPATVIFSFEPDHAWGLALARAGAHVMGGRLEGTHGGLDRESTFGFYLTNDPAPHPESAVRADRILTRWPELLQYVRPAE